MPARWQLHGLDDVVVAGAAADVAFELLAHLASRWAWGSRPARSHRAHHHARRAEAALQAVVLLEGLLHRVQRAVGLGQALDGGDARALRPAPPGSCSLHRAAVRRARCRRRTARCRSRHGCRSAAAARAGTAPAACAGRRCPVTALPLTVREMAMVTMRLLQGVAPDAPLAPVVEALSEGIVPRHNAGLTLSGSCRAMTRRLERTTVHRRSCSWQSRPALRPTPPSRRRPGPAPS